MRFSTTGTTGRGDPNTGSGSQDSFDLSYLHEWWKISCIRLRAIDNLLHVAILDRVTQKIPVVLFDQTTHAISRRGDVKALARLVDDPQYGNSEFLAGWIVFDIMEINFTALEALLGLCGHAYFLEYIKTQPDFQLRAMLSVTQHGHNPHFMRLLAIGVPFTQAHVDSLCDMGSTITTWSCDPSSKSDLADLLLTQNTNVNVAKLRVMAKAR